MKLIDKRLFKGNIFSILDAVFMLYLFKNINIKPKKFINMIGRSTLGVYLIHENMLLKGYATIEPENEMENYGGTILWDKILKANKYYYNPIFPFHMLGSIFIIFIVSAIIDIIRTNTVGRIINDNKMINRICTKFDTWYNEI